MLKQSRGLASPTLRINTLIHPSRITGRRVRPRPPKFCPAHLPINGPQAGASHSVHPVLEHEGPTSLTLALSSRHETLPTGREDDPEEPPPIG